VNLMKSFMVLLLLAEKLGEWGDQW
jgi:hypothetical protein